MHNEDDDDEIDDDDLAVVEEEGEGWEDVDSGDDKKMKDVNTKPEKKVMWDESVEPLQEGEELVYDSSAYQMLHRAKVEWPCLSCDIVLRDRVGGQRDRSTWFPQHVHSLDPAHTRKDNKSSMDIHKQDKFPYTVYFCAGSQSEKKNENKIYVMKWSDMRKTLTDDVEESDSDEDEHAEGGANKSQKDPDMRYESIPHKGCVNRIRTMHGSHIVATWNDQNEVGIYNI